MRIEDLRVLVAAGTRHLSLQRSDREEIVGNAMLRVQSVLSRKTPAGERELRVLLAMNARWAIDDFCRELARRTGRETLTAPLNIPQTPAETVELAAERREALGRLMAPLSRRERAIVIERALLDFDTRETAACHALSPEAARAAYSRAARRLRQAVQASTQASLAAARSD